MGLSLLHARCLDPMAAVGLKPKRISTVLKSCFVGCLGVWVTYYSAVPSSVRTVNVEQTLKFTYGLRVSARCQD